MIPKIYHSIYPIVKKQIIEANYLAFTVDGWTSKNQTHSLISLTGHYINADFKV
jgi:hypothetical protein